jgi:hypothetical protein
MKARDQKTQGRSSRSDNRLARKRAEEEIRAAFIDNGRHQREEFIGQGFQGEKCKY